MLWGGKEVERVWLLAEFPQAGREGCTPGVEGTQRRGSWGRAAGPVTLVIIWLPDPRGAVRKLGAG